MKYLKKYEDHNEGLKSGLAKAGIIGALLTGGDVKSQQSVPTNLPVMQVQMEQDGVFVAKNHAEEISQVRKNEPVKDVELSNILSEIENNINDSTKYEEMFNRLSTHIEEKYGYKIEDRKVEEKFTEAGVAGIAKNLTLMEIIGWLGSICLAICGIPQAWQSYKDKHSEGISWSFILLWTFGELFALAYVYDKLDLPLFVNYATNILILSVILYYKIRPGKQITENLTSKEEEIKNRIYDLIQGYTYLESTPYSFSYCSECGQDQQQISSESINEATDKIIELLKKEGLLAGSGKIQSDY